MNKHHDGLYSVLCDLDLVKLKNSCLQINEMVGKHFKSNTEFDFKGECATNAKLFEQYNFLMYPLPGIHDLYNNIKNFFYQCQIQEFGKPLPKNYYIQSWVNVYNYGEFIDWHGHGETAAYAWHGFFCVNAEPSKTTYRYLNSNECIDVESKNNLLVLGKSNTDNHRSWPWTKDNDPRITIAFDIVPDTTILRLNGRSNDSIKLSEMIDKYPYFKNHWIPI